MNLQLETIELFSPAISPRPRTYNKVFVVAAKKEVYTERKLTRFDAIKLEDLPDLKKRSLKNELTRQHPNLLPNGKIYWLEDLVDGNLALKGKAYWHEFKVQYPKIII